MHFSSPIDYYTRFYSQEQYEKQLDVVQKYFHGRDVVVTRKGLCQCDFIEKIIALIKKIFGFTTGRESEIIHREILSFFYWGENQDLFSKGTCLDKLKEFAPKDEFFEKVTQRILAFHTHTYTTKERREYQQNFHDIFLQYQTDHPRAFVDHIFVRWYRSWKGKTLTLPPFAGHSFLQKIDPWKAKPLLLEEKINTLIEMYQQAFRMNATPAFLEKIIPHAESMVEAFLPKSKAKTKFALFLHTLYLIAGICFDRWDATEKAATMYGKSLDSIDTLPYQQFLHLTQVALDHHANSSLLKRLIVILEEMEQKHQGDDRLQLAARRALLYYHLAIGHEEDGDLTLTKECYEKSKSIFEEINSKENLRYQIERKMTFLASEEAEILFKILQDSSLSLKGKEDLYKAAQEGIEPLLEQIDQQQTILSQVPTLINHISNEFFKKAERIRNNSIPPTSRNNKNSQKRETPPYALLQENRIAPFVRYYSASIRWSSTKRQEYCSQIQSVLDEVNDFAKMMPQSQAMPRLVTLYAKLYTACAPFLPQVDTNTLAKPIQDALKA